MSLLTSWLVSGVSGAVSPSVWWERPVTMSGGGALGMAVVVIMLVEVSCR